ncbi:phosphomannomutase [Pedobacter sp. UYP30]|uniref:HAD-IIB family hydrolase n=1 Tax=Pedobacter sp. UYP30 TaxID=1756400 RepID=UPI00339B7FCF
MKKLVVFDLDGTLAKSKSIITKAMVAMLSSLLDNARVAIISGADWPQFKKQVLAKMGEPKQLKNLSILPTCGTKFYSYKKSWTKIYAENFTKKQSEKIKTELKKAIDQSNIEFGKTWGEQIEDRGSQITFSALGQKAPLSAKKDWDPDFKKRKKIKAKLDKKLKDFDVNLGGSTSIDITKKGADKAYGIEKLKETFKLKTSEIMFIGDALFPGGNDHPAKKTGVDCIQVRNPDETKTIIEAIVACLSSK